MQIGVSYFNGTGFDDESCIKLALGLNELRKTGVIDDFRNSSTMASTPTDPSTLVARCNTHPNNPIAFYIR